MVPAMLAAKAGPVKVGSQHLRDDGHNKPTGGVSPGSADRGVPRPGTFDPSGLTSAQEAEVTS